MTATATARNPLLTPAGDFTPDVWRLLVTAAGKYAGGAIDRAELVQEAAVNLLHYAPGYDPARATLTTFVYRHVQWSRGRLLATAARVARVGRLTGDPLDPTSLDTDDDPVAG